VKKYLKYTFIHQGVKEQNDTKGKFFDFVIDKCSEKAGMGFNKEKKMVK